MTFYRQKPAITVLFILGGGAFAIDAPLGPPPAAAERPSGESPLGVISEEGEIRQLEQRLDASLSAFDELLLEEVRKAAAARNERGGEASAGEGEGATGGGDTAEATGAEGGARGEQGSTGESPEGTEGREEGTLSGQETQTAEGRSQRETTTTGGTQRGGRRIPPDIPDGRDDDIVARQIREAAEKETDPELREKLWDEYRKYRKSLQ